MVQEELEGGEQQGGDTGLGFVAGPGQGVAPAGWDGGGGGNEGVEPRGMEFSVSPL